MKVKFKKWNCEVVESKYMVNNRIALELLETGTEERIATATTNLVDEHVEENEVVIKNYSENEGIYEVLLKAGIIGPVKRKVTSGFVDCLVCDYLKFKK